MSVLVTLKDSEEEDGDDFKSADEQMPPQETANDAAGVQPEFTEEVDIPPELPPIASAGATENLMLAPEAAPLKAPSPMEDIILRNSPPIMPQTSGIMTLVNYFKFTYH